MIYLVPKGVLLAITLAVCLGSEFFRNAFSKGRETKKSDLYFFQLIVSAAGAASILIAGGGFPRVSSFSLWGGLLFGLAIAVTGIFQSAALSVGPWSYTTIIVSLSTVIPALGGFLLFDDPPIDGFQYAGLALILLCFFFAVKRGEDEKGASFRWLLLSALAFLGMGSIGLVQTWQQKQPTEGLTQETILGDCTAFLFFSFLFSLVFSLGAWVIYSAKEKNFVPKYSGKEWGYFVLCGVTTGLNHIINLFLLGAFDTVVFFPIVNGGHLLLTMLISILFFKERLTGKQWLGMALGVIALCLLCLFNTKGLFA